MLHNDTLLIIFGVLKTELCSIKIMRDRALMYGTENENCDGYT